ASNRDIAGMQRAQQQMDQQLQEVAQVSGREANRQTEIWRAVDDLKADDGRSMLGVALQDSLKKDSDSLLTLERRSARGVRIRERLSLRDGEARSSRRDRRR